MSSRVDLGARPAVGAALCVAAVLAACSGTGTDNTPRSLASNRPAPTLNRPLFTEDEYGVSSSPRIADHRGPTRKGGGSFKLGSPYKVAGRWYVPREEPGYDRRGTGSWYGDDFHGRKTANGEIFDMHALTAAHPTLPLPSYAYVTNLATGRTIMVRVNDRGPYVSDRIIDLSHASARALGYENQGHAAVRVRYAGRAPLNGDDRRERQHLASQPWYRGVAPMVAYRAPPNAPLDVPEPFPAGTAGRWSPTAYRSALAGKPLESPPPVRSAPQRYAALPQRTGSVDAGYATQADAENLGWRASPQGQPAPAYRSVNNTGSRQGLGAAPAPFGSTNGVVYVQVGTFRDQANAERMRRGVGHLGPVEVAPVATAGASAYRVRIGPMSAQEAQAANAQVAAQGVSGSRIVQD
jgi:rare lipoprotein A